MIKGPRWQSIYKLNPLTKWKYSSNGFHNQQRLVTVNQKNRSNVPVQIAQSSFSTYAYLFGTVTAGVLIYYYLTDVRSLFHKQVSMPILRRLYDAEDAHHLAIKLASCGIAPVERSSPEFSSLLSTSLFGKKIESPIGLAAGFDKNADAVDSLLDLGFGFVEIGSVTPQPQPGNPKPRMFRLPDDLAVINRYGFNSEGSKYVEQNLRNRIRNYVFSNSFNTDINSSIEATHGPEYQVKVLKNNNKTLALRKNKLLGVNLGKNKLSAAESNDDYIDGVKQLGIFADYIVINVSSPNTPGLRLLQKESTIESLLSDVKVARDSLNVDEKPPLLVKVAPDLSDEDLIAVSNVVKRLKIDGIIIGNTTIQRPDSLKSIDSLKTQTGGLSGAPLRNITPNKVKAFYEATNGEVPIIGCGGISTAEDAIKMAKAGASAVQVLSALTYDGPGLVHEIKSDIAQYLHKNGQTWQDIIGTDTSVFQKPN